MHHVMWLRDLPTRTWTTLRGIVRDDRGATAVEYGLIIACIVIIMVVSLHGLADVTTSMWNTVSTKVTNAS